MNHFCILYCSVRQGTSDQYHPTERARVCVCVCVCVCVFVHEACVAVLSADRHTGHVNSSDSLKAETILGGKLSSMEMYAQTIMAVGCLLFIEKTVTLQPKCGEVQGVNQFSPTRFVSRILCYDKYLASDAWDWNRKTCSSSSFAVTSTKNGIVYRFYKSTAMWDFTNKHIFGGPWAVA